MPASSIASGPSIVRDDGQIDRGALAAIVFRDETELAALNAISHPAIDAEIADRIADAPTGPVVVLDMAVLVETDLGAGQYDTVVVVEAPLDGATGATRAAGYDRRRCARPHRVTGHPTSSAERSPTSSIDNGGDIDVAAR